MRELLKYFYRFSHWTLLLVLAGVSLSMIFTQNSIQQISVFNATNQFVGSVHQSLQSFRLYWGLSDENERLLKRIGQLEVQVSTMQYSLDELQLNSTADSLFQAVYPEYRYTLAQVVSNSISRVHNFMIINRGTDHGVEAEMGVANEEGIVGVVERVGTNYSSVISILNPNFRLSSRIRRTNFCGSLIWDCVDSRFMNLEELPRHAKFAAGDTIESSGYSMIFPEGIPIGVVDSEIKGKDSNYYTLRIRLFADLSRVKNVNLIRFSQREEIQLLEVNRNTQIH